ncbi:hypothetical protein PS893_00773 [Pseudomonas fluorescens]|jgi:hypothetical protein|uniref:Uncharacterized protein n=1 Tax=Pseudomonas fluorescens TaxID=294 RepID=A0A5E6UPU0_PSEFL|nr:hypothetical protein PS673_03109 [Pseudomonas fluorescens]VVN07293.1 hypothetical protein PS647_03653 [Pseudomonas fluorescens]VVO60661.1 hypothetical protein PS893_00773 [Pseudomonas fluorescens]
MDVNENAIFLNKRVACNAIASKLAPTSISRHFNAGSPMFIFFQPCNSTCALGSWPLSR